MRLCYVTLQYPDAWGADASTDSWFYENYIGNRARLAHGVVGLPGHPSAALACGVLLCSGLHRSDAICCTLHLMLLLAAHERVHREIVMWCDHHGW